MSSGCYPLEIGTEKYPQNQELVKAIQLIDEFLYDDDPWPNDGFTPEDARSDGRYEALIFLAMDLLLDSFKKEDKEKLKCQLKRFK